ncbi:archaeal heat shock protein Hsp20 [Nitrososphaera sp.]|uniref:archaeal heat shock protein Hsp20 n=1 Tax=Nitrososphaera sp. TaxID=1971748 RepID=UPI00307F0C06
MSSKDKEFDEWFRRFFPARMTRFGFGREGSGSIFSEFEEMRREMEKMFEDAFRDTEKLPKDLVREYETEGGGKVREVGPIVYGYSVTIGPDGKPRVREFGNVKSLGGAGGVGTTPELTSEREPLADVVTSDKDIKVVVEMPGVTKDSVKVNVYDKSIEVKAETPQRKYRRTIELPPEADTDTAKSTFNNGILEITFGKKKQPKGKEIRVE